MLEDLNVIFQANTTKEINKHQIAMEISMKQSQFCTIFNVYRVLIFNQNNLLKRNHTLALKVTPFQKSFISFNAPKEHA